MMRAEIDFAYLLAGGRIRLRCAGCRAGWVSLDAWPGGRSGYRAVVEMPCDCEAVFREQVSEAFRRNEDRPGRYGGEPVSEQDMWGCPEEEPLGE